MKNLKFLIFFIIFLILSFNIFSRTSNAIDYNSLSSLSDNIYNYNISNDTNNILNANINVLSFKSYNKPYKLNKSNPLKQNNSFFSHIKLFGTFAASYTYNFAKPCSNETYPWANYNGNYIDNYQANGGTINQFDITISKNPFADGRITFGIGFKVTLDTGQNIQAVGPYTGNFSYYTEPVYNRPLYGFRQFYLSLGLLVGNGLKVEIGEKNYLIGFEPYNLSRLWENTYSPITAIEPGELTGIFLSYHFIKQLKTVFGIALTNNAMVPINRYPTFEFIAAYKPFKAIKFHEGIVYGAENFIIYNNNLIQDNANRFFYNFIDAKYSPLKYWDFVLDYEVGLNGGINKSIIENNNINVNKFNSLASTTTSVYPNYLISTSNSTYDKSHFSGIAFYIHHFNILNIGRFSQTLREVSVSDPNGMWEPASTPGVAYHYFDSTLTFRYRPKLKIFKNVQFRLEFENQISNHKIYGDGHYSQDTVNTMVTYTF